MTPPHLSLLARLDRNVVKTETCWLWTGAKISTGYGVLRIAHRNRLAHRVSYALHTASEIPPGLCVLHRCDTPACVNPAHLFLGTKGDNVHDMDRKGRRVNNQNKGEQVSNAKLTEAQVREIRCRRECGESHKALGMAFGIVPSMVWLITTRRAWKHVA